MKKLLTLAAIACAAMSMNAQSLNVLNGTEHSWDALALSANHRYVAGAADYNSGCFVWDTQTGEVSYIPSEETELRGVSNEGIGVGFAYPEPNQAVTFNPATKTLTTLPIPEGSQALANDITPDGTMIVGLTYDAGYNSSPCYWLNGEYHTLTIPTDEQAGFEVNGARAERVSADGKVILGTVIDNFSTLPPILWRLNDKGEYELQCIAYGMLVSDPYAENPSEPYGLITPGDISENGQWISLTLQKYTADYSSKQILGRMNLDTKAITEICDYASGNEYQQGLADRNLFASGVSNDGTVIGYTMSSPWDMPRLPREALIATPADKAPQLISSLYCTAEFDAIQANGNTAINITGDGQYIQGYVTNDMGNNSAYLLSLTESGINDVEAATEAVEEVYNLQGVKVNKADAAHGIYVVKSGNTAKKVVL